MLPGLSKCSRGLVLWPCEVYLAFRSSFSYFSIPPSRLYLKFTLPRALLIPWHFYQALEFPSWEPHPLPFVTLSFQLISTRGCPESQEDYGANLTHCLHPSIKYHPHTHQGGFSCSSLDCAESYCCLTSPLYLSVLLVLNLKHHHKANAMCLFSYF